MRKQGLFLVLAADTNKRSWSQGREYDVVDVALFFQIYLLIIENASLRVLLLCDVLF